MDFYKMTKFSLISEYQEISKTQKTEDKPKISYQEYELNFLGENKCVLIPLRETENFEKEIEQLTELDKREMTRLMRKYRGIMNQG